LRDGLVTPNLNKNDVIEGAGKLDKNDVTWGQANSTAMLPDQKVNKAKDLTFRSINIAPYKY
jgi:hypothetical protein